MTLDTPAADRAAGVLMGLACGDALGAPHEFGPPLGVQIPLGMTGGGSLRWGPGEWTDDTQMAIVLLQAAEVAAAERASGANVRLVDRADLVALGWIQWQQDANDVGAQTATVLSSALRNGELSAAGLTDAARRLHAETGRTAGNGSLMRTAPVALAYLHDEAELAEAARYFSKLTHADPVAGDACVLWCLAIRTAVLDARLNVRSGLRYLDAARRDQWGALIEEAERLAPVDFPRNGWVVHAFQAAWSAVHRAGDDPANDPLRRGIEAAVRAGRDADTVAAIAGCLLGARWGRSAIPSDWRAVVHGWPGLTVEDLGGRGLTLADA